MSGTIEYPALDLEKREIRLITVGLNKNNDVACQLSVISLDSGVVYTALSYVWGTEEPTECIWVDGYPFMIRRNLYGYLRLVATEQTKGRGMFIDAICIKQDNMPEITHQVGLMGRVYRGASEVTAWFGLEEHWTTGLVEKFPAIKDPAVLDLCLLTNQGGRRIGDERSFKARRAAPVSNPLAAAVVQGLKGHAYWTRLWTVQEYILPKNLILRAGELCFDPSSLAEQQMAESVIALKERANAIQQNLVASDAEEVRYYELSQFFGEGRTEYKKHLANGTFMPLNTALRFYGGQDCLRVRDHIFGLLGLCNTTLIPDYGVPLIRLYARVLMESLREIAAQTDSIEQWVVLYRTELILDKLCTPLGMSPRCPGIIVVTMIALGRVRFMFDSQDYDMVNWYLDEYLDESNQSQAVRKTLQEIGILKGTETEIAPGTCVLGPEGELFTFADWEKLVAKADESIGEASLEQDSRQ
ncbi:hypothetical protein LTR10_010923 [Elasticomyces elasticus]|nr:hypothetical protein LTR10_010923 [Elasticomyces elasticus]KAK4968528.1 hypothetical protein LTR42_009811 [Elasticomyces elasticus]